MAVLSESTARTIFPGEEALGRRVRFEDGLYKVVGVAGDVQARVETDDFRTLIYLPLTDAQVGRSTGPGEHPLIPTPLSGISPHRRTRQRPL